MEKQTLLNKLGQFNDQLNLTHYWIVFLKYRRLILILPVLIAVLGYLVALNIKPNMEYFYHMIPCGIFEYGVTSMYDLLNKNIPLESIIESIAFNFEKVFMENY